MYTLSINITSACKEMLDNLLVTVETVKGDLSSIESIELLSEDKKLYSVSNPTDKDNSPNITQRNLFLDKWMMNERL